MNKRKLQELFDNVFDEHQCVRACGRQACIDLIEYMEIYTSLNVGNAHTGIMNVDTLVSEYNRLMNC